HERPEEVEFPRREHDLLAPAPGGPLREVELQIGVLDRRERAAAADDRADPRDELLEIELLRDVVVGAESQALHPLLDGVEAREEDHRRLAAVLAELEEEVPARLAGHLHVEQDQVEGLDADLLELLLRAGAVGRALAIDAGALEAGEDVAPEVLIV